MRVLVTGATGFIGRAILERAGVDGAQQLRAAVRRNVLDLPVGVEVVQVGNLGPETDWSSAVRGVDAIVHAAGRAHVRKEWAADPLREFRRVNAEGTVQLARQGTAAGVQRLVYISSIGVNGGETFGMPFSAADTAAPQSPYALSKYEAEVGLQQISRETGLDLVVIRPPLVFGPRAPGNFAMLMHCLRRGVPLPLGAIRNRRSLVGIDNLIHLIITCLRHSKAPGQTFLVSDGEDLSTTDLLRRLGQILGRSARLLPVSAGLLRAGAALLGQQEIARQLCGSLQVDISKNRELLGWVPPVDLDEGLRRAALHL